MNDEATASDGKPVTFSERDHAALQKVEDLFKLLRQTIQEEVPDEHTLTTPAPLSDRTGSPSVTGYEILGEVGRGGMGIVYKARQVALKRLVALKMILAGPQARSQELSRFRSEAQAIARLQHPNIVQIHEVGDHEGQPFFSLEFVDGGSLARKLGGVPQSAEHAANLVATVARAVQAAHERGVIHRDLKPSNVLVADDGTPKITDFGLAKHLDDDVGQTQSGAILGTPSYMSPEQATGNTKDIGVPSDVYALGAILYEMLTGRPPFRGPTVLDTLDQVRSQDPVPPRRLQPTVPRDLELICLKCLEKDPFARYSSAKQLADDLGRFLADEPIHARPLGFLRRTAKWTKRRPAGAALIALAFVALSAMSAATMLLRTAYENERDAKVQIGEQKANAEQQREKARRQKEEAERQRDIARRQKEAADYYANAILNVEALASQKNVTGDILYKLAALYAISAEAVQRNATLDPKEKERVFGNYADRAIKLLGQAKDAGYFTIDKNRRLVLATDSNFEAIRGRKGFDQFLQD